MRQLIAIALATSIVSLAVLSTPARSLEPVPDGSFENGAPPASLWSETTNHSNDCPTAIADWQSIFQATAPDGSKSFWAGGFCNGSTPGAITNSASQVLTVPVDDAALSFGYLGLRIDANNPALDDVAYVSVDGTDVWTRDASTAAVNTWNTAHTRRCYRQTAVDLGAYAGTEVTLEIGMRAGPNNGVGNVQLDDLRFGSRFFADSFECADLSAWSGVAP